MRWRMVRVVLAFAALLSLAPAAAWAEPGINAGAAVFVFYGLLVVGAFLMVLLPVSWFVGRRMFKLTIWQTLAVLAVQILTVVGFCAYCIYRLKTPHYI